MKNNYIGILSILASLATMITITVLDCYKYIESDKVLEAWVAISYTLLIFGLLCTRVFKRLIKRLVNKTSTTAVTPPGGCTTTQMINEIIESGGFSLRGLLLPFVPMIIETIFSRRAMVSPLTKSPARLQEELERQIKIMSDEEIIKKFLEAAHKIKKAKQYDTELDM